MRSRMEVAAKESFMKAVKIFSKYVYGNPLILQEKTKELQQEVNEWLKEKKVEKFDPPVVTVSNTLVMILVSYDAAL